MWKRRVPVNWGAWYAHALFWLTVVTVLPSLSQNPKAIVVGRDLEV